MRFFLIMTLALFIANNNQIYARKQPKIHIEKKTMDFGIIYNDNPIKTDSIIIHNKGKENLIISDTYTDCSCTIIENKIDNIPPGQSDTLIVKLRVNKLFPGKLSKHVYIQSNSPKKEKEVIVINAEVRYKQ